MRRFSFFALFIIFICTAAAASFAQTGGSAQASTTGKIGLINTNTFGDEKAGITKYRNAATTLNAEFKKDNDDLAAMAARYEALAKEIEVTRNTPGTKPELLQAKIDEAQNLQVQAKRKQEDTKAKYGRRYQILIGPIFNDIIKTMNEFAKQNGYAVILDGPRLEESGVLMGFDNKYDVTAAFIAYYNSRQAGASTATAVPK